MRPLYLQGRPGMQVVYEEPALVVKSPDRTRQLFPLGRVSRVVVTGQVEWSMPALFACAESGVTVLFIDCDGEIKARWLGQPRKAGVLQGLFQLLSQQSDDEVYADWREAMQRMAARSVARRLRYPDWQMADWRRLNEHVCKHLNGDWLVVRQWLGSVVVSAVTAYLLDYGAKVDDENEGFLRLTDDLGALLLADFDPLLLKWAEKSPKPPESRVLLQHFESRGARLEHLLRGALSRLHRVLNGRY